MKIATWNINSINMRLDHLRDFVNITKPDIVLLQELKCETDKFPYDQLSDLPYNFYIHGQKSYNGVAILSKFKADDVIYDFPSNPCSEQSRFIEVSLQTAVGFFNIISLYAPNGGEVNSDKFEMKLKFYDALTNYLDARKSFDENLIIGGDFNIAPFDIDVYSPKLLKDSTCFTPLEKTKMRTLLNSGFDDIYRILHPTKQEFSWWDYRAGAFEQNKGMRIDTILSSHKATGHFQNSYIEYSMRSKLKPSDHVPVIVC
jgi:exodeoxyribonuclease-3